MILLGCLLAFGAAVAPRVVLILAWIFSERWDAVWQGEWIWPLLGIIFLPYTTILFLLAVMRIMCVFLVVPVIVVVVRLHLPQIDTIAGIEHLHFGIG